jgi:hypothetical protein
VILRLCNNTSTDQFIASNGMMIVNGEVESTRKKAVAAYSTQH